MSDFAEISYEFGLLSDEDKAIISSLIHKLTPMPIDDEPITQREIEAIADMQLEKSTGHMKIFNQD